MTDGACALNKKNQDAIVLPDADGKLICPDLC